MNDDIRAACRNAGFRLWEVAEHMGIADSSFSRMLRHELPDEKKQRVLSAIDELATQRARRLLASVK